MNPPDVVVTWLLNNVPDPQRRERLPADPMLVDELRRSVAAHGRHLIVLHDCLEGTVDDEHTRFVHVPGGGNPYWYRWRLVADLLDLEDYRYVWCVDGTDVVMLNDPFPHMEPGRLYVGSEEAFLGEPVDGGTPMWLRGHCPSVARWLETNRHLPVLNVGTVGGERRLVEAVARELEEYEVWGDDYEMGVFNLLCREFLADELVTGHPVHTRFLRHERSGDAWWAHK